MNEIQARKLSAFLAFGFILSCGPRNHAPDVPAIPVGPAYGLPDSTYAFSTSTSDPDGDSVALEFSWGSSTATERTGLMAGGEQVVRYNHWRIPRVYKIRVRAIDKKGRASDWTPEVEIEIVHPDSLPLTPLRPEGPDSVRVGFIEEYSFPTRGPPGESLVLTFDWGDIRIWEEWEISCAAGETVRIRQAFPNEGDWHVRARAQDGRTETRSPWSAGHRTKVRDAPTTGWERVYDAEEFYSVAPTGDGDLALTGAWGLLGGLVLLKADMSGNVVWWQEYESLGFDGVSVRETSDGGLIVAGSWLWMPGSGTDIARTDGNGRLLWHKYYGRSYTGCGVRQAPDGGFVVATGYSLLKTDKYGDSLWAVECGAWYVELTPDRGYVVSGSRMGSTALTKFDSTGAVLWSRLLGAPPVYGVAIEVLPDGGYILAGDSAGETLLWKVNADGKPIWKRRCFGVGDNWVGDVSVATNGDVLLSGTADNAPYLARTDAQGKLKWQRRLCREGFCVELLPTADGGCVVAGADWGEELYGAALWKVDENGGIGPEGYKAGAGARGGARTAWRARAERLRSAMRGERGVR